MRNGLFCLGAALAGIVLAAMPARATVAAGPDANGIVQLSGQTETGKPLLVRVSLRGSTFEERREARTQEKDKIGNDWWGGPDQVIATLEVRIGSDWIPLFRSAYSDLGQVRLVELNTTKGAFFVTIYGGETGTGYSAKLRFKGGFLLGREVRHNEMGLEEKTEYYPVQDDNN
jgi:hypothetical protein